jgi:hypothetical protein
MHVAAVTVDSLLSTCGHSLPLPSGSLSSITLCSPSCYYFVMMVVPGRCYLIVVETRRSSSSTHTHTHTRISVYLYIYLLLRELSRRQREREASALPLWHRRNPRTSSLLDSLLLLLFLCRVAFRARRLPIHTRIHTTLVSFSL